MYATYIKLSTETHSQSIRVRYKSTCAGVHHANQSINLYYIDSIRTTQDLLDFKLSQRCCWRFRSSGNATVPRHLNIQNKISTTVALYSGLYMLYPEIFVLTLFIVIGIRTPVFYTFAVALIVMFKDTQKPNVIYTYCLILILGIRPVSSRSVTHSKCFLSVWNASLM